MPTEVSVSEHVLFPLCVLASVFMAFSRKRQLLLIVPIAIGALGAASAAYGFADAMQQGKLGLPPQPIHACREMAVRVFMHTFPVVFVHCFVGAFIVINAIKTDAPEKIG